MKVKLYGTRGSIPTPSDAEHSTIEFGGNTTCIYIEADDGTKHIVDAGSGIRKLGLNMLKEGYVGKGKEANLYFSHTHWDHIQGFPFFVPAYIKGNNIAVYGEAKIRQKPMTGTKDNLRATPDLEMIMQQEQNIGPLLSVDGVGIKDVLKEQQNPRNFPASLDMLGGITSYVDFMPDNGPIYLTETLRVDTKSVNHPGGCISYKFTETKADGKQAIVIVNTDFEPVKNRFDDKGNVLKNGSALLNEKWVNNMTSWWKNADLVLADSQYEPERIEGSINPFVPTWGHSDYETDIHVADRAGVKKILLTHHEPKMDDKYHTNLEKQAKHYGELQQFKGTIELAREGRTYEV